MTRPLPVLVECPPYSARLAAERCVERHREAIAAHERLARTGWGVNAHAVIDVQRKAQSACRTCALGVERSGA